MSFHELGFGLRVVLKKSKYLQYLVCWVISRLYLVAGFHAFKVLLLDAWPVSQLFFVKRKSSFLVLSWPLLGPLELMSLLLYEVAWCLSGLIALLQ